MMVTCPHCKKEHGIEFSAAVPDEQKISITIESESEVLPADALGKLLVSSTNLLQDVAKNTGGKVAVFVEDIEVSKHKICAKLLVSNVKGE